MQTILRRHPALLALGYSRNIASANVHRHNIRGWMREQNFAGGRVTREFAQKWVDFLPIEE
jgi:hypothetical protein